MSAKNFVILE